MTVQKAGDRVGCSLAGSRVRKLRTQEREKLVRRTRGKPFDVERQDVGVFAIGQLEFHRHRAGVGDTIVHVRIPARIGETHYSWDRLPL